MGRKPLAPEDIKVELRFEGENDARKIMLEVIKVVLEDYKYHS